MTKTLELNPLIQKIGQEKLPAGFLLRLPPLPIKKSKDWVIKGDLLIFTDHGQQEITYNKEPSWVFKAGFHSTLENISLQDKSQRTATIKTDKSWGVDGEVIYQTTYRSFHLDFDYDDLIYSDGAIIKWSSPLEKRLHYQLSINEKLNQKYSLKVGIGKSDLLSFKIVAPSTLEILRKSRLYASIGFGYGFSFFLPIQSRLDLRILESFKTQGIAFEMGYEALLSLKVSQKLSSGAEFILSAQAGYRDDAPKNFKQNSKFISLGFGLRWGGK